eukprot:gene3501-6149_t
MTKRESSPEEPSLLQINKNNVVEISCRCCDYKVKDYSNKHCIKCGGALEWLCKCGARRSYSNLSVHSCAKTSKRQKLKEKFAAKKKLVKERIQQEIVKPTTEINLIKLSPPRVVNMEKEHSPIDTSKLDVMKIENLLSAEE